MKKQSCIRWAAMAILIVLAGCGQETFQIQKGDGADCKGCADQGFGDGTIGLPPDISYFSPKGGSVGSMVTINGSRFSATPSHNIVRFNGVQATVTSATTIKLVVTVPPDASSGKISVSVSGLHDVSQYDFIVVHQPPTIASFAPSSGYVPFVNTGIPGTVVTLYGTNFSPTPANNIVKFNGTTATVSNATTTGLTVSVPQGATSGKISVTTNNLTGISSNDFTILPSDRWEPVADFGGTGRIFPVSFVIGNKAYVGTGYYYSRDFWQYSSTNNTWTQKADFGGMERTGAAGFAIGTRGYVGMGSRNGEALLDFWEYNRDTNTWIRRADFAGTGRNGAADFAIGSRGYVGTGLNATTGEVLNDFWEYDPATDQWTRKADFGGAGRGSVGSFVINSKGYIGGGVVSGPSGSVPYYDFWEYDPATDNWTAKASIGPNAAPVHSGFFSIGSKGYAGGQFNQLWMFDPITNTWTRKADLPISLVQGTGFAIDNSGYIGLGSSGGTNSRSFYRYIPD
jgi:N-acetylneuraminic acid mutarotase